LRRSRGTRAAPCSRQRGEEEEEEEEEEGEGEVVGGEGGSGEYLIKDLKRKANPEVKSGKPLKTHEPHRPDVIVRRGFWIFWWRWYVMVGGSSKSGSNPLRRRRRREFLRTLSPFGAYFLYQFDYFL
jgi:hypothetical protein